MEGSSGVILVGGESRRMGTDKALLSIGGQPLIQRVAEALEAVVGEVLLVGSGAERYAWLNLRVVNDLITGGGPLAGIYTGLRAARFPQCLVVACDMPFLNTDLLSHMLQSAATWDAVVPRHQGWLEPLHAVYVRSCLEPIQQMLEDGNLCPLDLFPSVRVRHVETDEMASIQGGLLSFVNVNTPTDLELARAVGGVHLWGHKVQKTGLAAQGKRIPGTAASSQLRQRPMSRLSLPGGTV